MDSSRRWRRITTMATIGGLVVFGLSGGVTEPASWTARLRLLAICLIYGHGIALAATFALPSWLKRFARRNRLTWWAARVAALPIVCAVGGAAAMVVLLPLGLIRSGSIVSYLFPYVGWGPAPFVVGAVFLSVTGYDYLRDRLDIATLALRTKERDEADAKRLAVEAQLASLESRVQPHFLFNTLNSIAALIPQDPAGAEKMTGQLASLLRASLDAGAAQLTALDEELRTVRDYLEIERVRFGDRLRFRFEVNDELGTYMVPRLSLQTLVENSVKYAIAPRREGGTIVVRGARTASQLRLEVDDDGPGFGGAQETEGHGLALLRDRLRMAFGDTCRLVVRQQPGHTTVAMEMSLDGARLHR